MDVPTDNPLDEETARTYFRDVIHGLEYCESLWASAYALQYAM